MRKVKKTHESKGKTYAVPRSATFKPGKKQIQAHATHGGGSKKHK